MSVISSSRRNFLKYTAMAGAGLVIGLPLSSCAIAGSGKSGKGGSKGFQPDAFLQLTPDNQVHFYLPRSEMGQGTYTGLTDLIAEELDVEPQAIQVHHVGAHSDYENPEIGFQATGGSTSMRVSFYPLRQAGANVRAAILTAAARQLGLEAGTLSTGKGRVLAGGKAYPYGEFASLAATLPLPDDAPLKSPKNFTYLGKDRPRLDGIAKSTGTAEFGLDVDFPGLYRAVLRRCPVAGGTVKSVDDSTAKRMPGVKKVVILDNGVAVVAEGYWQAKQAAASLVIDWHIPEKLGSFSSDSGKQWFTGALDGDDFDNAFEQGDGIDGLESAAQVVSAEYWAPYLAHSTMEPMNCTVKIDSGHCHIWAGCQAPDVAVGLAARICDLSTDQVTLHSTFLGGGFGRRFSSDFVVEAVSIAKASGLAVQLVWSREDDTRHDFYRPASLVRFKVGLDNKGMIQSWTVKRAGPNIMPYTIDEVVDGKAPGFLPDGLVDWVSKRGYGIFDGLTVDHSSVEGLYEDYDARHKAVQHVTLDPGLPVGFWRSVGHSFSGFFKESMMDELAHGQKQDSLAYRLAHSKNNPRLRRALELVAEKSGWGRVSNSKRFQGIACHTSFKSTVAQVAEVSVANGQIHIHKITCVVDCGFAVNPDMVKAQMESGIIYGLTAALHGEITVKNGEVQQSNFHDYPMLRINETPEIEVHLVKSDADPTGVGEPGVPPVAAAVANAVFAATGTRLRSLPLRV
ncbi:xanthine dehydrogenase family protein molybdopterin-binding subunit [Thalassomonas viridans]|uniref:Xanthine dehydrogenase family protein molybdopterin-binding subunit n=1 Tax=Thalassomonas viridans TaxID=137584 RepID=A0AAE9Z5A8_9GAMM|nr:molybdopterin cofactor-binding domain-containing protein [Thalassomonas viridans]WDE07011.1 xanthine dehydrogenase family protein molybdopterin-binding subunit [Thalassomonas viridans]